MNPASVKGCRLCGGPAARLDAPLGNKNLSYARCERCGYVGLDPEHFPGAEEEKKRYLLHRNSPSDPGYLRYLQEFLDLAVLPYLAPGARALDFGSGPAPVLSSLLESAGFGCDCFDPFFLPDLSWQDRTYDAILLHEVAEHLHDPARTLLELAPRLAPRGIIAIRTRVPPADAESFRTWWYRMDPTHVGFFTPKSLEMVFTAVGLHSVQCSLTDCIVLRRT